MLLKVSPQPLGHALCHRGSHAAVAEFGLGLSLELRLREFDGYDGGESFAHVLAGQLVRLLEDAGFPAVIVDDLGDRSLEAVKVRAALFGVDVVGERENGVGVGVVVLHGDLDLAVDILRVEIHDVLENGLFVAVEALHEGDYAAFVAEHFTARRLHPLVRDLDGQPFIEIRKLSQTGLHGVVVEIQRFEYVAVGIERDGRARVLRRPDLGKRTLRHAAVEAYAVELAALPDLRHQPLGERVDAGHAHAVQTARYLVSAAAEFAARVKFGQHDFDGGFSLFFYHADGYASSVVRDAHRAVGKYLDRDVRAVACKRLVYGVVNDFRHEMMKSARVRGTDVHSRTLPYGIQSLEHLNVGRIIAVFDFFHASSFRF